MIGTSSLKFTICSFQRFLTLSDAAKACKKIEVLSVAELLGKAIRRIHNSDSVSSLFI